MKITNVEAIHIRIDDPNIGLFDGSYDDCLIVVSTDEGLTGIGEVESFSPGIKALVEGPSSHNHARGLREVIVGKDPTDPETLWEEMYDATNYVGRRGMVMHAIGGVDIALWDIAGQVAGKPIHELLGGKVRDRVQAYGTIYPMARTTDAVKAQISDSQKMNLTAHKFCADPWWHDDIQLTENLLKAAREEAGEDAKLIVDCALYCKTYEEGARLLPIFKEIGIWFLEAPLPLDNTEGHRKTAEHGIPVGVGDLGLTHVDEFIDYMDRWGASICQPDITMVGGFTGLKRISRAALERGKRVITHGYKTNIEIAANLHFLSNHPDEEILEWSTSKSPIRWNTTKEKLPVEPDGKVAVPTAPGLGVTLDWDFVNQHRVQY